VVVLVDQSLMEAKSRLNDEKSSLPTLINRFADASFGLRDKLKNKKKEKKETTTEDTYSSRVPEEYGSVGRI